MGKYWKRLDPMVGAMEDALAPGVFIGYHDNWNFIENLRTLKEKIASLEDSEPARAVGLLEGFIAGCYEKSEEINDSGGCFGMFVEELFCDWLRARQAAKSNPEETAEMLLSWMQEDEYGYCCYLENEAVKVFNRAGLAAFELAARRRLNGVQNESYLHRRSIAILKAIQLQRRDVDGYAALCEEEGGLTPRDCELLAEICLKGRKTKAALAWVERGMTLEDEGRRPNQSGFRLQELRWEILKKLGRGGEALAEAWEDYRKRPSVYSYENLMKFVPKTDREDWHARAIGILGRASLGDTIDILVKSKEWKRLARVINRSGREELVNLSHFTTEPAAKKLARTYPLLAAKVYAAQGLRILEARKSKYYGAALGHFAEVRKILLKEGCGCFWDELVAEVRESHSRKTSFMPGFERLVEGRSSGRNQSFLAIARKKWVPKTGSSSRPPVRPK